MYHTPVGYKENTTRAHICQAETAPGEMPILRYAPPVADEETQPGYSRTSVVKPLYRRMCLMVIVELRR